MHLALDKKLGHHKAIEDFYDLNTLCLILKSTVVVNVQFYFCLLSLSILCSTHLTVWHVGLPPEAGRELVPAHHVPVKTETPSRQLQ